MWSLPGEDERDLWTIAIKNTKPVEEMEKKGKENPLLDGLIKEIRGTTISKIVSENVVRVAVASIFKIYDLYRRRGLSDELVVSRVLSKRIGVFGRHQLLGLLHVGESGERFWHVQQIGQDIVRNYCVQNKKVFSLTTYPLVVEPFSTCLERGSEILDMRGDLRDAIHDAIASWEAEEQTVAYGRVEL